MYPQAGSRRFRHQPWATRRWRADRGTAVVIAKPRHEVTRSGLSSIAGGISLGSMPYRSAITDPSAIELRRPSHARADHLRWTESVMRLDDQRARRSDPRPARGRGQGDPSTIHLPESWADHRHAAFVPACVSA